MFCHLSHLDTVTVLILNIYKFTWWAVTYLKKTSEEFVDLRGHAVEDTYYNGTAVKGPGNHCASYQSELGSPSQGLKGAKVYTETHIHKGSRFVRIYLGVIFGHTNSYCT
jgi:hypothetical protein